ncbi:MAG: hypothetical protein Q8O49_00740 [bacterium]|nr:hypothetical protein [bacterium]
MKIAEIPDFAMGKFFPVLMLLGIIAAGLISQAINEKIEVLIAIIGILAIVLNSKWELRDSKIPEWKILLKSAAIGMGLTISVSLALSILFRTSIGSQLMIVSPLIAMMNNRNIARRKIIVLSTEILFQITLIIQLFVIIIISDKMIGIAIIGIPLSFILCFIANRIEQKIKDQINARQDQS